MVDGATVGAINIGLMVLVYADAVIPKNRLMRY